MTGRAFPSSLRARDDEDRWPIACNRHRDAVSWDQCIGLTLALVARGSLTTEEVRSSMIDSIEAQERVKSTTARIAFPSNEADLTSAYIERAHCFSLLGENAKSLQDYLSAFATVREITARVHVCSMLALGYLRDDKREHGVWWALKAVDLDPSSAEAQYCFGLACARSDLGVQARSAFAKVIEIEPDYWPAYIALGARLRHDSFLHESVAVLTKYVTANPNCGNGLYELGRSIDQSTEITDRTTQARTLYKRALEQDMERGLRELVSRTLANLELDKKE